MNGPALAPVRDHLAASHAALTALEPSAATLADWAALAHHVLMGGGQLLAAGNGGSAAHAQHLTSELVGRFDRDRRAFRAVCLSADTSALTAIGNDYGFEQVFARQVAALAGSGGAAIGLSTSGRSANVLEALRTAAGAGMLTIAVTGSGGTGMAELCDHLVVIPSDQTPHIQEGTMLVLHVICELVEQRLFGA